MQRYVTVPTLALALLWHGGAAAQSGSQTGSQTGIQAPAAPVAGRAPLGVTVIQMEEIVVGWSTKRDLLDKTVVNDKNDKIGKIDDLIISPSKSDSAPAATFAIIGVGGFLGIGKRDVAIPAEQLKMHDKGLSLPGATKDALKALPPFVYQKK